MIKYVIHAKKWRDKINGNTYHSAQILKTENNLMIASSFTYGYGDQFIQTASERMKKQGWIKERLKGIDLQQIHIIVEDDCKKKDVISHGLER
jgi:hypothetical protein